MKHTKNPNPLSAIHLAVREVLDTLLDTVLLTGFIAFFAGMINVLMAEKASPRFHRRSCMSAVVRSPCGR
jgi:hypothetical protein